MKKISCKIISCALIAAMALPVASCGKKNSKSREKSPSGTKITADSPWFENNIFTVKPELKLDKKTEYVTQSITGIDEDYMVIYSSGYYKMPTGDNVNWETFNSNDYAINMISVIDRKTEKTLNTFDFSSELPNNGYIERIRYEDGKVVARASAFDSNKQSSVLIDLIFDAKTGKLADKKEQPYDYDSDESQYGRIYEVDGYKIGMKSEWDEEKAYCELYISQGDGEALQVELKSNETNYYDIPIVFKIADNKVVAAVTTDKTPVFYEVDLQNAKADEAKAGNYDWLNVSNIYYSLSGTDGSTYYSSANGIYKIDVKNKKTIEIFNYSWCSVSRKVMNSSQLVECSDDRIVLSGELYTRGALGQTSESEFFVLTLNRAATNPHAGKTIIELYSPGGYVEENICDAVAKFNETSSTHYIEVHDRYSNVDTGVDYSKVGSDDDMQNAELKYNASMSNELAMDILNGEGPDILLNCSSYGQLNNANYLVDLNKYVGTLDSNKYFTNVIEAAETDGKLYQFPLCYMVSGIHTDVKYAGKSGVGFTTAEYEKFLNETLNGKDIINYGQAQYFTRLFTAMSDKFIVDGKVDFSGPEFEELAEFVKKNVPERAKSWNEMYDSGDGGGTAYAVGVKAFKGDPAGQELVAVYTTCYGLSGYFYQMAALQGASGFLGIPSTDGRGPMLEPYVSVAVSAQSKSADACGEFVKMLMSDDVQQAFAKSDNLILNREAFRAAAKDTVEYFNGEGGENFFGYAKAGGNPNQNRIKFSEKNVDEFEKIILSISRMNSADASINLILVEEMPAYFSGQKELADVIKIAQDRAQKVISERG